MKSNNFYTMYDEVLTDKEIYNYALLVDEFRRGQITYKELKEKFSNEYGIEVRADYAFPTGMTIEEHSNYIDRINSENPSYNDISYFIISGENFNNVQFRIDYKVIEVLANNNIRYYMEAYKAILETQVRHSYDKSAKLKAERNAWKRKIVELQEKLSIDTGEKTVDDKYDMGLSRPPRSIELLKGLSQIDDILFLMKEAPSDSSSLRDIFITIMNDLEKFLGQTADALVIAAYIKKCFLSKTEEEYNNSVEEFKEDLESNNIGVDIYNYCMSVLDLYDEYFPKKNSIKIKRIRKKNNNNHKS